MDWYLSNLVVAFSELLDNILINILWLEIWLEEEVGLISVVELGEFDFAFLESPFAIHYRDLNFFPLWEVSEWWYENYDDFFDNWDNSYYEEKVNDGDEEDPLLFLIEQV